MFDILVASAAIMFASLVGVFTVWGKAGNVVERKLDYLTSFSAGVFLVVVYHLSVETVEHAGSFAAGFMWILTGALGIWVLFKLLPTLHHHHVQEPQGHVIDPRRLLISDGVHNVGDGVALAASFLASSTLGVVATLSIFFHELVQEISEFFVLRKSGYSPRRALFLNFLVSSTILIGSIGAYFLLGLFELIEAPLLGLSAGAFLVVVLSDLIPHSLKASHGRTHILKHILWFVIGVILMFLVSTFGGSH
jgi:zinc transporter ZupT